MRCAFPWYTGQLEPRERGRGTGGEHECERAEDERNAAKGHTGESAPVGRRTTRRPGYPAREQHVESRSIRCRCRAPITTRSSPPTVTPAPATRRTASTSRRGTSTTSTRGARNTATRSRDLRGNRRLRNWDDELRNSQLEADGIVGEVVFPNTVPPFFPSFVLFARPPKPDEYEHRLAGIRAHNRWLADWCARFPERRAGIGQIFLNDVDDAIDDVKWIKRARPARRRADLRDPARRRLREAAVRPGLRTAVVGVRRPRRQGQQPRRHRPARTTASTPVADLLYITEVSFYSQRPFVQLLLSGVFERHPRLQFVMTEMGCAWLPPMLERFDAAHQEDQHDRRDRRAPLHRRAQAAAARERLLPPELLGRREPARSRRRRAPAT